VPAGCGDGVRDPGEGCDEGTLNSDSERGACRTNCAPARCGDGVVDDGEECDDGPGNRNVANACRTTCVEPSCGDGILDTGEVCDNGGNNSDVAAGACRTTCVPAGCGDGVRDPGEGCDEGTLNSDSERGACRTDCAPASCGDGVVDDGEECDDGPENRNVANACRTTCVEPSCGDGVRDSGERCDNGSNNSDVAAGACRTSCAPASCGDGVRDPGEGCDEGTLNSDTEPGACRTSCATASCGDGVLDNGEQCDDGNTRSGDGCRNDCGKVEVCGDREVDVSEECDDGNDNPRDGCAECGRQSWSYDLVVSGALEELAATSTAVGSPVAIAFDVLGRMFIAETANHRIRRVDVDGSVKTIAGTGVAGFAGDGGPAALAELRNPAGVAIDNRGDVVIADTNNHRIRRIDRLGVITTIAGTGQPGDGSSGGPATATALSSPRHVAFDAQGRVLVSDTGNHRVRRLETGGTLVTVAGTGSAGFNGDNILASTAQLSRPDGLAVDPAGNLYIADANNNRIRRILAGVDGTLSTITTVAGTGGAGYIPSGEGAPAIATPLFIPRAVAIDGLGRIVIVDARNQRIRRVDNDGTMRTIAGNGFQGFSGEGSLATDASFNDAQGIAVDREGQVLVADTLNNRIRRIEGSGALATTRTVVGTGVAVFGGDGGPADSAALRTPVKVLVDDRDRVIIVDQGGRRLRRVATDGTIDTIAGTGVTVPLGDGGPATSASFVSPTAASLDASGRILIADEFGHRVRRIDAQGTTVTLAGITPPGGSSGGDLGDGGPATSASLLFPRAAATDSAGRVLILGPEKIRRIDADGIIDSVPGASGFSSARALLVMPSDELLVADAGASSVYRLANDGVPVRIAGTGVAGFSGDTGPATLATFRLPEDVAVDAQGRILVADTGNHRIRRIDTDGIVTTIAGNGVVGVSGDGGPALNASLNQPRGICVDARQRVWIADTNNQRVRRIEEDGTITTVAGPLHPAGPGPTERARVYPVVSLTPVGRSLLSVGGPGRVLRIDLNEADVAVVAGYPLADPARAGSALFAPLLRDARGVTLDPVALTLVVTEHATGDLRIIGLDPDDDGVIDDAALWTNATISTELAGPAGIVYDDGDDTFVVADEADHCVQRIGRDGVVLETVFGRCGSPGLFPGFLSDPTHVLVSPFSGAFYVADTGNHRVLRVDGGATTVVVGDGSVSSAGEGAPARLFPVNAPRQLAMDSFGNLYVTSTTTVRLVANVDGDADADGDDRVATIFGGGARDAFPESDAFCLHALTVDADDRAFVADACQGFLVELLP
jgi:cysteine-rich repeat protein